jgi:hypothetical protein
MSVLLASSVLAAAGCWIGYWPDCPASVYVSINGGRTVCGEYGARTLPSVKHPPGGSGGMTGLTSDNDKWCPYLCPDGKLYWFYTGTYIDPNSPGCIQPSGS